MEYSFLPASVVISRHAAICCVRAAPSCRSELAPPDRERWNCKFPGEALIQLSIRKNATRFDFLAPFAPMITLSGRNSRPARFSMDLKPRSWRRVKQFMLRMLALLYCRPAAKSALPEVV